MTAAPQDHPADHKAFLAALPPDTKAALTQRSTAAGLWHLAGHIGAILCVGSYIALGGPFWPLLLPVQGVLLVFLFTLEHEASHQTPFANRPLNEAMGHLTGFVVLVPFLWFRAFHLAHHRWTNIAGKDPELESPKPATRAAFWWHVSGLPLWAGSCRLLWALICGRVEGGYIPAPARPRIILEARIIVTLYACAALFTLAVSPVLIWVWVLPMLLGQPALRLYLLAEHGDCPEVADMFQNTRTTFTTAALRFVAWNMPYHVEHHVYPQVPFHNLPALHALMRDRLQITAQGYRSFAEGYLARRRP